MQKLSKSRGWRVRKHARLIRRGNRSDSFLLALLPISGKLTNKSGRLMMFPDPGLTSNKWEID